MVGLRATGNGISEIARATMGVKIVWFYLVHARR
jgi:hypothetical protein